MAEDARTPGEVFAQRLREVRTRRGWSQRELAERLMDLGVTTLSRATLAKIEAGRGRAANVSVADALAIASALGVSPLALVTPARLAEQVAVTPKRIVSGGRLRGWIRQSWPLSDEDDRRVFFSELPTEEFDALLEARAGRAPSTGGPAPEDNISADAGEPSSPPAPPDQGAPATEYYISAYAGGPAPPPAPPDEETV